MKIGKKVPCRILQDFAGVQLSVLNLKFWNHVLKNFQEGFIELFGEENTTKEVFIVNFEVKSLEKYSHITYIGENKRKLSTLTYEA